MFLTDNLSTVTLENDINCFLAYVFVFFSRIVCHLFLSFYRKIDYEKSGRGWNKMMRASPDDWTRNLETIVQWSPYSSEEDLLQQVIN